MRAVLAHYGRLGFEVMPYRQGMTWAWTRLEAAELHLFVKDDHDPATTAAAADLQAENIDELHRALREPQSAEQATRTARPTAVSSFTSTRTTTSCDSSPRPAPTLESPPFSPSQLEPPTWSFRRLRDDKRAAGEDILAGRPPGDI
jgi:hypothetical protein